MINRLCSLDGNWNELDVARGQQTLHSLDGNWKELDRGTWSTDSSQSGWKLEYWNMAISNLTRRPGNESDGKFQLMKNGRYMMVYSLGIRRFGLSYSEMIGKFRSEARAHNQHRATIMTMWKNM